MPRLSRAAIRAQIAADYNWLEARRLARLGDDAAAARERAGLERVRPGDTARGPRRRRADRLLPAPEPAASPQTETDPRQGEPFLEVPPVAPAETRAMHIRHWLANVAINHRPDAMSAVLFPAVLEPEPTPTIPVRLRPPAERSAILDAIIPVSGWYLPITTEREGR